MAPLTEVSDTTAELVESPPENPRQARRFRKGRFSQVPHISGLILGVFSVLVFLWSISPVLRHILRVPREYIDSYYFDAPDTSLSWALVVALLAAALASRKRIAWWLLTIYLALITLTNIASTIVDKNPNNAVAAVVLLVVIGILIAARPEFYTRVRRGAGWKALGVLIGGMAVATVIGWGLVELFPGDLPQNQRFLWALNRVTAAASVDNEVFDGHPRVFVNTVLGLLGAIALLAAVMTLFRAQRSNNALTGNDESAIRGLIQNFGADDSLAYFATRRDKAVIFAPSGKAAITYRVEIGVCLASGDPIGDPEAWPHAIEAWQDLASQYGWATAVMGASETGATAYKKAGLSVLQLGDEAILRTREFNLNGRDMRPVRQAVTRVRRHGVTVRMRRHRDIPPEDMAAVIIRADDWRDTDTERGFSMALGRLGDHLDGDCLLVEAVMGEGTEDESVVGMLSLVPWGPNGVSLDLMRRKPTAPNGVVELMVSELATRSDEIGVVRVSLNFAVFRSVFEEGSRIGAGPILRIWRSVLVFFSRWWQLEALYRSNVKYQPDWEPRFLCFEDNRELPTRRIRVGHRRRLCGSAQFRAQVEPGRQAHRNACGGAGSSGDFRRTARRRQSAGLGAVVHDQRSASTRAGPRAHGQTRRNSADEGIAAYPVAYPADAYDRSRSEVAGGHPRTHRGTPAAGSRLRRSRVRGRARLVRRHPGSGRPGQRRPGEAGGVRRRVRSR